MPIRSEERPSDATFSMTEFFIPSNVDLQPGKENYDRHIRFSKVELRNRWDTEAGRLILKKWKDSNFDREQLNTLVGKLNGQMDLRGIPLSNESLESANLTHIDFYCANLEGANLSMSDLGGSWLSESNIKRTRFDWAKLDRAFIDNVTFDGRTSFIGVNLNAVNFTLAALLQDLAITQQRIENMQRTRPILAFILWATCDYGRSFIRFFFWALTVIVIFAYLYHLNLDSISRNGLFDSFYFSVVTFTTLGFGDITPLTFCGKLLVISEVVLGYIMLGLLVAIISRRIIGE